MPLADMFWGDRFGQEREAVWMKQLAGGKPPQ